MTMTPPVAAPIGQAPSNEERILAAIAHLALFFGFWMIGPVAVYVIKRKESRHAAFHAAQAFVLWALHIPISVIVGLVGLVGMIALAAVLPQRGGEMAAGIGSLAFFGCISIPTMAFLGVSIVAAVRAYGGTTWSIPLVGGIARKLMSLDKEALQPDP